MTLQPAKTNVSVERGWALRKAEEVATTASKLGANIKIDLEEPMVTASAVEAFAQDADDLGGTFYGAFSHLKLP